MAQHFDSLGLPVADFYASNDPVPDESLDADSAVLYGLGYRQEFKRKFNLWSIFSLSFSSLGLLPSMAATLVFSLGLVLSNTVLIVVMLEAEVLYGVGLSQL